MGGSASETPLLAAAGAPGGRFRRCQRLLKPAQFRHVFADPVRVGNGHLTVLGRPNGLDHARLGLAISKKHLRSAVARNRVKRQVRESFRHHQGELVGLDLVVLSRAHVAHTSTQALREALERHWQTLLNRCARSS